MEKAHNTLLKFNRTAACIILIGIAPFALCAVSGLYHNHSNCALIIFFWLITITGLLAAKQIRGLASRYALTISKEFIIYKKPFTSQLIRISDLLAIHTGPDNNLVFKTLHTTIVVPLSIFACKQELTHVKTRLERFAPPTCRIDVRTPAMETL